MSLPLSLARSATERVLHAICFEIMANLLVFSILVLFTSAAPAQSGVLTVVSSLTAMLWNYLFNLIFDRLQIHMGFKKGLLIRSLHAVTFEAGLLMVLIPFAAWWLDISLLAALRLECGLVLFFLIYTLLFNLLWDTVRDYRLSRKR
ncbi:PACE efflux transporter [Pantoea sp. KPR_PJ]|uniref:PACE efflux transporter n=1 Tax=Pantoea sp. KPR_PJ TaxID=2738375 RepID=UPI0035296E43